MKRFVVALVLVLPPLALGAGGIDFAAANDVTWDSLGTDEVAVHSIVKSQT
jgi:hypothetical protein